MTNSMKISRGITLPVVLVFSLTIMIVMMALLTVGSAAYKGIYIDHYQKMADEAAEAGTAYATACLTLSSHSQTWGPAVSANNLAPKTDCSGANNYPSNLYVYSDSKVRTYFSVGDLDYSAPFAAQISSTGTTEVLNPSGTVNKTYTSIKKKVITWPTDVGAQMSASGTNRTCAIVNYSVYCWGYNGYGQLGNGQYIGPPQGLESTSSVDSTVPVKVYKGAGVMANKQIVKIFVAQYHSCALSSDGLMYCWGYNGFGQLGTGNYNDSPVPVQVGGALAGKTITDIGGTGNVTCAIASGKIYCWGQNNLGTVGVGSLSQSTYTTPTLVSATNTPTTLSSTYTATVLSSSGSRSALMCAIADNKAYCWGQNDIGSVGDSTTTQRYLPTKVQDGGLWTGKTLTSISQDGYSSVGAGGFAHVCAVASGKVYCWGDNGSGQIGDNTTNNRTTPVAVNTTTSPAALNGKTVQDVKVGLRHSCVMADNSAYCWGLNNPGQVGDGTTTTRFVPVQVQRLAGGITASNVVSIGAGSNRGCAVINDGRTFCWGLNTSGQIGDGTLINRTSPTESLFLRPTSNQFIF